MMEDKGQNGGHMNRANQPPYRHPIPGTVYRMRAWRLVKHPGVRAFFYTGWM